VTAPRRLLLVKPTGNRPPAWVSKLQSEPPRVLRGAAGGQEKR